MRSTRVAAAVVASSLAAVVALCAIGVTQAQVGIGQVNGTVFGADRKGMPGLPVAVVPQDGRFLYGTSTDSDGRYALKGMPPGTYTVLVGMPTGVVRKDGIRIRPLFRSIVDFTAGGDTPAAALPGLHAGVPSPAPASGGGVLANLVNSTANSGTPLPGAADGAGPAVADAPPAAPPSAPSTAETTAPGIAMDWMLMGPEKTSAPDAWVAAIPVQGAGELRRGRTDAAGGAQLDRLPPGQYHLLVRAPGFMTWRLGPLPVDGGGKLSVMMTLVPYPMGFTGTLEDLLIPADPIPLAPAPKRP